MGSVRPFKIGPHLVLAFGGTLDILNLIVGTVSTFHQISDVFHIKLSPVLGNFLVAYAHVREWLIGGLEDSISWLSSFDFAIPLWAHDGLVLWFVMAGTAERLVAAYLRGYTMLQPKDRTAYVSDSKPPGYLLPRVIDIARRTEFRLGKRVADFVSYLLCAALWPIIVLEVQFVTPASMGILDNSEFLPRDRPIQIMRLSGFAIFWLQTAVIALAAIGLAFLNNWAM